MEKKIEMLFGDGHKLNTPKFWQIDQTKDDYVQAKDGNGQVYVVGKVGKDFAYFPLVERQGQLSGPFTSTITVDTENAILHKDLQP